MKTKTTIIISSILFILNLVFLGLVYPSLPDNIASHWDINRTVNGYMDKNLSLLFIPLIVIVFSSLLFVIPKIDPLAKNIKKFQSTFNIFILGFCVFLFYIQDITILVNLGYSINMTQLLIPALAVLIFLVGILIEKAEPNYTIGIRTPWTLASSKVWYRTHKLGGKLFKISALISLIGLLFPNVGIVLFLVTVIGSCIFLVIYSFITYRNLQ